MARGYRSALISLVVTPVIFFSACSSGPARPYGNLHTGPIPSGYEKKNDLIYSIKPEIREKAKEAYNGINVRSDLLIPHSETKLGANGLKVKIPWEKLDDVWPID